MKVCLQTTTRVVVVGGCGFGLPTFNNKYFSFFICHFKILKYPFPHNYCRSWKSGFDLNEHPYYWCNPWSDKF